MASDLDLVRDAINIAWPSPLSAERLRGTAPAASSSEEGLLTQTIIGARTPLHHITPKMSTQASPHKIKGSATLIYEASKISTACASDELYEGSPHQLADSRMEDVEWNTSQQVSSSQILEQKTHAYLMNGAPLDPCSPQLEKRTGIDQIEVEGTPTKTTPNYYQHSPEIVPQQQFFISTRQKQCSTYKAGLRRTESEVGDRLSEKAQLRNIEDCSLRDALQAISPKVSRQAQAYARKKTREMLEREDDAYLEYLAVEGEVVSTSSHSTGSFDEGSRIKCNFDQKIEQDQSRAETCPLSNDDRITTTTTKESCSETSVKLLSSDMSKPRAENIVNVQGGKSVMPRNWTDRGSLCSHTMEVPCSNKLLPSMTSHYFPEPYVKRMSIVEQTTSPEVEHGTQCRANEDTLHAHANEPESSGTREMSNTSRGTHHSNRQFTRHRGQISYRKPRVVASGLFEVYDEDSELNTSSGHQFSGSSDDFLTLPYAIPIHCSPSQFARTQHFCDLTVRPSVERDTAFRYGNQCAATRDSTPGYDDRSSSPSPIDHQSSRSIEETEVKFAYDVSRTVIREDSMPPDDRELACNIGRMLPPPSPSRSKVGSPQPITTLATIQDPASPSMLRSPAIARVRSQSELTDVPTQFPSLRQLSPVAGITLTHESVSNSVGQFLKSTAQCVPQAGIEAIFPAILPVPMVMSPRSVHNQEYQLGLNAALRQPPSLPPSDQHYFPLSIPAEPASTENPKPNQRENSGVFCSMGRIEKVRNFTASGMDSVTMRGTMGKGKRNITATTQKPGKMSATRKKSVARTQKEKPMVAKAGTSGDVVISCQMKQTEVKGVNDIGCDNTGVRNQQHDDCDSMVVGIDTPDLERTCKEFFNRSQKSKKSVAGKSNRNLVHDFRLRRSARIRERGR